MSDNPTSVQYALGVSIGHLLSKALSEGASYDEVIATLQNCIGICRFNAAISAERAVTGKPAGRA